jgi:hypothetical protein
LSDNLIGKDENLNAVKPDITTGGEALAGLLREGECRLKTLKVRQPASRPTSPLTTI